ncbi:zonadhesin [Suncus etruscus]|uniref:zonadhesin n=1 Tax=Suncus etruscus TaxID=109475 RepID=UPI00210F34E2|nr:zonadhesin [Suncus etruscus]
MLGVTRVPLSGAGDRPGVPSSGLRDNVKGRSGMRGLPKKPLNEEQLQDTWQAVPKSASELSIITQCDFEDNARPLCDWSQDSNDDGNWTRDKVSFPDSGIGPPGGYPKDGYYLHMLAITFPPGGVARLRSPLIWEQGPMCIRFAYRLFGFSWGAQLRLLLQAKQKGKHPITLWKHRNYQSPSWVPTAITVPAAGLFLPRRLVFEGVQGSTSYLDIALDAISLHKGSCNQVCIVQMCNFDKLNDLCGWSWVPTATGAKWVQKKGPSGVPDVGPDYDFSRPGGGFYMLLDPKKAKAQQKSALLSPVSQSRGCLSLSLHYTLRASSPGASLTVFAKPVGNIRKHTLLLAQPTTGWKTASVNYTGQGFVQFIIIGMFGKRPEPAVAVDEITIAPCGDTFPGCDFEDDKHPFCDWSQVPDSSGEWAWGNKSSPETTSIGGTLKRGFHFIYLLVNKYSLEGQDFRLMSRPFCAPGAICVEFVYQMFGIGNGTIFSLLLSSPAGTIPKSIWIRVGSQKPEWQNASVTIPPGLPQPMQLILKATRGSNMAFIVAVGFIGISQGACRGPSTVPTETSTVSYTATPTLPSEQTTGHTETTGGPTKKPTLSGKQNIKSQEHTSPPKGKNFPPQESPASSKKCIFPHEKIPSPSVEENVHAVKTTLPEKQTTPHEKSTVPSKEQAKPTVWPCKPIEGPTIPTKEITIPTKSPTEKPTERPTVPTEKLTVPTEKPTVPTEKPTVPTEKSTSLTEKYTVPTKTSPIPTGKPTVPTEKPTIPTEKTTVTTEKSTMSTEKHTVSPEELTKTSTVPTESTIIPTEKPTVPTEKTTAPTEKSTVPTEKPTVSTEKTIVTTEKHTVPTEELTTTSTVPTENTTVPTEKPTVPTETSTILTVLTDKPKEKTTVPTETLTTITEMSTISTERLTTAVTEKSTVPIVQTTVPTEKPTIPTEKPTVPTEKSTVPTQIPLVPTQSSTTPETSVSATTSETSVTSTMSETSLTTTKTSQTATTNIITTQGFPQETCPLNAHFENCGCLASCTNSKPNCGNQCQRGCVCDSGYLFSNNSCIEAASCSCFHNNNYYKTGDIWFSANCSERCHCLPGSQTVCQMARCAAHSVCQLRNGHYRCHPYGSSVCSIYGHTNYISFDGNRFRFLGKCTYIMAQPCGNSTEPFFRVTAKNGDQGLKGTSSLSHVYVTLPKILPITLLKDRRVLYGGQELVVPMNPSKGIFLFSSGRFLELQTPMGLKLRWDGEEQLFINVPSTYSGKLCGLCGNYDGDKINDNRKPNGEEAKDEEELGNSWRTAEDEDKECQKTEVPPASCDSILLGHLSGPQLCGRLVDTQGPFAACLPHVSANLFFENCMSDMCNFQGMPQNLCSHLSAFTETCQEAGYTVKPWREPQFCPLSCPKFSKYNLCSRVCPENCYSNISGQNCQNRCTEGCQCDPGYLLSGLNCKAPRDCGCMDHYHRYWTNKDKWYKPGCRYKCECSDPGKLLCYRSRCSSSQVCNYLNGQYGCHQQNFAFCTISGDSHYQTFDGALNHFMGTCTYVLTKSCMSNGWETHFIVSATKEFRLGNQDTTFISAVHVEVYNMKISLLKGAKVVLNGERVLPPLSLLEGRVILRYTGIFLGLYFDFGLLVRYDGNHFVEVKVPAIYAGRLCGLCGNYNNNSLDDNELSDPEYPWKIQDSSEAGCFTTLKPQRCLKKSNYWEKDCNILMNPQGPFSKCHNVVAPQVSFSNCAVSQCGSRGDHSMLCRSLQAYAAQCSRAGLVLNWRNSTFCPLRCPRGSKYSTCVRLCQYTCQERFGWMPCPPTQPCSEGCQCEEGHFLNGVTCIHLHNCGCSLGLNNYHSTWDNWYSDKTCSSICSCSSVNQSSCHPTTCGPNQWCWTQHGLTRCRNSYAGICSSFRKKYFNYESFDGAKHEVRGNCSYILAMSCHFTTETPFFKISVQNMQWEKGPELTSVVRQIHVDAFGSRITLQRDNLVLINGTQVKLPYKDNVTFKEGEIPKPRYKIWMAMNYTRLILWDEVIVKFKGDMNRLTIQVPGDYYDKVCGICGNYNGEIEDDHMMPNTELALNEMQFVSSWQDKELTPNCLSENEKTLKELSLQVKNRCLEADLSRAQEQCQEAFRNPAWVPCAVHLSLDPYLLRCTHSLCLFGGLNQALCQALQAFEADCLTQGLRVDIWRNSSFCPLECPAHSFYTTCLSPCLPTCGKKPCRTSQESIRCQEGCECEHGFLLNDRLCVPESQCGCKHPEGGFLAGGKTWVSPDCTQSCICTMGSLQCSPFTCPSGSHCQFHDQDTAICKPDKSEQCSVFGDPHYLTFDGLLYTFHGRMTYTLLRTINKIPEGLEPVEVEGRNRLSAPWVFEKQNIYTLYEVIVRVHGYVIHMMTNLELVVNKQRVTIPFKPNDNLQVTMRGHRMYLVTNFELVVSFDGKENAVISLPTTYQGLVRGLCGNFDQDKWNDFTMPDGTRVQGPVIFGNSWETKKHHKGQLRFSRALREEEEEEEEVGLSQCSGEQQALINSTSACTVLVDPQGPFAACHHLVAPKPFQEHCVLALCGPQEPRLKEEMHCQILGGYASTCQEAGSILGLWRKQTHCALECPPNTIYQSCMSPCPASCATLEAPRACRGPCMEGCASLPGYAYSGTRSLPRAQCGCTSAGRYYQQGESFLNENCSQRCTCVQFGLLQCQPHHCHQGEICSLGNLTRGCFRESPCLQNPCHNDGRCLEQGNHFVCKCEPGYGGHLCTEPDDRPDIFSFMITCLVKLVLQVTWVLLVVLVLLVVVGQVCVLSKKWKMR